MVHFVMVYFVMVHFVMVHMHRVPGLGYGIRLRLIGVLVRFLACPAICLHLLDGLLKPAFAIEHELSGRNDLFSFQQSGEHAEVAVPGAAFLADADFARFEPAFSAGDEHDGAFAGAYDCFRRHDEGFRDHFALHVDVSIHARLEIEVGIRKDEADVYVARFLAEIGVDVRDLPGVLFPGQVGELHRHGLPHAQPGHFVVEEAGMHPYGSQIGDLEEIHAGLDVGAFEGVLLDDHPGGRRRELHRRLYFAPFFEPLDFRPRNIPEGQSFTGRLDQPVGVCTYTGHRTGLHALGVFHGQHVFLLGRDEFGRIDVHQRLSLAHFFADEVDVEGFDPA